MKTNRHQKILELISRYPINTQEELIEHLRADGYDVTQSTVSRDIKQLRLVKTLMPDGKYRYQQVSSAPENAVQNNITSLFSGVVLSVRSAMNMVVIKTHPGMAQSVCVAFESLSFEDMLGTIAGDDTIFALCADELSAKKCAEDFLKYIG